jgi:hypothetical protein
MANNKQVNERKSVIIDTNKDKNHTYLNLVSVGDFDCKKETKNTIQNIINLDPVYVLALGDYSYGKSADCWFKIV